MILINKEQFLEEHNKLSSSYLQATPALLDKFKEEKRPLLKDNEWCLDKLRIPFISWLAGQPKSKKKTEKNNEHIFKDYPETHYEA